MRRGARVRTGSDRVNGLPGPDADEAALRVEGPEDRDVYAERRPVVPEVGANRLVAHDLGGLAGLLEKKARGAGGIVDVPFLMPHIGLDLLKARAEWSGAQDAALDHSR